MSGPTASARLVGSVHGVVVHASSRSPVSSSNQTVTAGVLAVLVDVSSIRVSVLDSGVSPRQQ